MNQLLKIAAERINELDAIITGARTRLKNVPDGRIATHRRLDGVYYTFHCSGDSAGRYLSKKDLPLILSLAQKEYDQKVLRSAELERKKLIRFASAYPEVSAEQVYEQLGKDRQVLVTPIAWPDDVYIRNWLDIQYPKKGFSEEGPEFYTSKGERVRSKSEVIIADTLARMGVPYRYEFPIRFSGTGTFHPDFTVLNVRQRKEFYWEHLGMMDNDEYVESALSKIEIYQKNGCFPGSKLILTYESGKHPLHIGLLTDIIQEYLL
ncbi:MAG: hypothetical protein J6M46_05420 [Lachnospiraceae bacterium]|nr:hypothetical protein [Lachnospiraceae bacterium]